MQMNWLSCEGDSRDGKQLITEWYETEQGWSVKDLITGSCGSERGLGRRYCRGDDSSMRTGGRVPEGSV